MLHLDASIVLRNVARSQAISRISYCCLTTGSCVRPQSTTALTCHPLKPSSRASPARSTHVSPVIRTQNLTGSIRPFHTTANGMSSVHGRNEVQKLEPVSTPRRSSSSTLFGRDELVQNTVESLLNSQHVVLLGFGGVGKTSVARAILEHADIAQKFENERYFISFDDLDMSDPSNPNTNVPIETFIDRIFNTLGLNLTVPEAKSIDDKRKYIVWRIQKSPVLLVFDHAQWSLSTKTEGFDFIASAIDEFISFPTVTLLVTTDGQKSMLPGCCKPVFVLPLDINAARETFGIVYQPSCNVGNAIIEPMLNDLRGIPLSLDLVARVARQNHWAPEKVAKAWVEAKPIHPASSDAETLENLLASSVDLVLNSEVLKDVKAEVIEIIRTVAFFPQGIRLSMLPPAANGQSVEDLLSDLGVIQLKGNMATMSPPLRKAILTAYGDGIGSSRLISTIRSYYYAEISRYSEDLAWFFAEDTNVEKLIAHDLREASDMDSTMEVLATLYHFLNHLALTRPRSTILEKVVLSTPTPHEDSIPSVNPENRELIDRKALCLCGLGDLAAVLHDHSKAMEMWEDGLKLCRLIDSEDGIRNFLNRLADRCTSLGKIAQAGVYLKEVLEMPSGPVQERALNLLALGRIKAYAGSPEAAELFDAVLEIAEHQDMMDVAKSGLEWRADVAYYQRDHEASRSYTEALIALCKQDRDLHRLYHAYLALHGVAVREGDMGEATNLLDRAKELALSELEDPGLVPITYALKASMATDAGDHDGARSHLRSALVQARSRGIPGTQAEALALYVSGRSELLAGDYAKSKEFFETALPIYRTLRDTGFEARTIRALGEICLLEGEKKAALAFFQKAEDLCDLTGTHPDMLYKCMCFDTFALPERFGGWEAFLDGRM